VVERTPNLLFANGVDGPMKIGARSPSHPQGSTDPREWHMLIERPAAGPQVKTAPLDRPVSFERGQPLDIREQAGYSRVRHDAFLPPRGASPICPLRSGNAAGACVGWRSAGR